MTRRSPLPLFTIQFRNNIDEDSEEYSVRTTITARASEDILNGIISLDEPEDLILLRDTINDFISRNKHLLSMAQKNNPKTPNAKPLTSTPPGYCYVLEGYLNGWAPAREYGKGVILKTSQDIVNDLEDMTALNAAAVSDIMSQLGFRAHFTPEGLHGWMLLRVPGTVHTIRPAEPI